MDEITLRGATAFGHRMRQWRRQRGLSQLALAMRADVSQRHISFIETGRSRPKEAVIHKVAEALEIPLRERNALMEAAGLAPGYPEIKLSHGAAAPFRNAIAKMLETHEPYPAYVINRWWELVDANAAGRRLFPHAGDEPVNLVDVFFGPGPYREMIENFPSVAWAFLRRMRAEVANAGPDERLQALLERVEHYLNDVPYDEEGFGDELVLCPRLKIGDRSVKTITMVARFGSTREVTLDELRVELVFPGDDEAEFFFRQSAG